MEKIDLILKLVRENKITDEEAKILMDISAPTWTFTKSGCGCTQCPNTYCTQCPNTYITYTAN